MPLDGSQTRFCSECRHPLPFEAGPNAQTHSGVCRDKRRKRAAKNYRETNYTRLREYRLVWTEENRESLKTKFRMRRYGAKSIPPEPDKCEVCGSKPKDNRSLNFDHDHQSGEFRGWLCDKCNQALGLANDDPQLLRALARYLENE